jgi:hypothetical protein
MHEIDPALLDDDNVRAVLDARDVGALYRLLGRLGVTQRQITQLTDQSQSEVCEILKGVRDPQDTPTGFGCWRFLPMAPCSPAPAPMASCGCGTPPTEDTSPPSKDTPTGLKRWPFLPTVTCSRVQAATAIYGL